jgi:plasmid maintenance system antidote protein VapI
MDAGFWMGLQADFDLWHASRAVDLSKITPLKK